MPFPASLLRRRCGAGTGCIPTRWRLTVPGDLLLPLARLALRGPGPGAVAPLRWFASLSAFSPLASGGPPGGGGGGGSAGNGGGGGGRELPRRRGRKLQGQKQMSSSLTLGYAYLYKLINDHF
jgi:P-type Cu+ transporter